MPILTRGTYQRHPPPSPGSASENGGQMFYLSQTQEIIPTYQEYVQRYSLCRRPVWQCTVTGKMGLTYEQARELEVEAERANEDVFCEPLRELILRFVHGKTQPTKTLLHDIAEMTRHNFFEGEKVYCGHSGSKKGTKHVQVVRRIMADPAPDYSNDSQPLRYVIQYLDGEDQPISGSEQEVAPDILWRSRSQVTRDHLKSLIRSETTRAHTPNAPLLLKRKLRERYGIRDEHRFDYREQDELSNRGTNQTTVEVVITSKRKSFPDRLEHGNKKPRKKGESSAQLISQSVPGISRQSAKANSKKAKAQATILAPAINIAPIREHTPKPVPIKFPIDDLELLTLPVTKSRSQSKLSLINGSLGLSTADAQTEELKEWPRSSLDFIISNTEVERLLSLWSFFNIYSRPLSLSPFSLEDLEQSLQHYSSDHDGETCNLFIALFCAPLNVIIDDLMNGSSRALVTALTPEEEEGEGEVKVDGQDNVREEKSEQEVSNPVDAMSVDDDDDLVTSATIKDVDESRSETPGPLPTSGKALLNGRRARALTPVGYSTPHSTHPRSTPNTSRQGSVAPSESVPGKSDPESILRRLKRQLLRDWKRSLIPATGQDWTKHLLGWLLARAEGNPGLGGLASHLCEVHAKAPEGILPKLEHLSVSEKLTILESLVTDALGTWIIRDYIEECHEHLTVIRKDRIDAKKELKLLNDEHQTLTTQSQALIDEKDPSEGNSQEGQHSAVGTADLRKAARKFASEQQDIQRTLRKIEEQQQRLLRRLDQLDRDTRRYNVFRMQPLGSDRFYNTYWYLDGVGGGSNSGTGRLFVRFAHPDDVALTSDKIEWPRLLSVFPDDYPTSSYYFGPDGQLTGKPALWGYYSQTNQIEQLERWLNPKGNRELVLQVQLQGTKYPIINSIKRRQQELNATLRSESIRKSSRIKSGPGTGTTSVSQFPYMRYVNKLAQ
ncbi:hypothetical protein IWQ61_004591 [Dispira simplex]|nr:hypothetical protein IWQ61_004591 [Dispira simplex]